MDADSQRSDQFVETALTAMATTAGIGAVGGVFYGQPGHALIGQLQRNEYVRYARAISRRGARALALTGTGTLFRVAALRRVAACRGKSLPGRAGQVCDTLSLAEDNEMTLALKTLGYDCRSPRNCRVTTEIMPDLLSLWRQRIRWQHGAPENLRHYGLKRVALAQRMPMELWGSPEVVPAIGSPPQIHRTCPMVVVQTGRAQASSIGTAAIGLNTPRPERRVRWLKIEEPPTGSARASRER